jgi:hypothetical protein
MSDTPRTDKHLSNNLWSGGRSEPGIYEFARELERELDSLKKALRKLDRIYRQEFDDPGNRPDWLQIHFENTEGRRASQTND